MSVDMDVHGYPWIWISMDIHRKSVDMDVDMDVKFHIHGNPADRTGQTGLGAEILYNNFILTWNHA